MNRKMRRKLGEQKKEQTYMMKASDLRTHIHSEVEQIRKEVTKDVLAKLFGSLVVALHDEFGFGKVRIDRFIDKVNEQFDSIENGYVTLEDFNKWSKEKGFDYQLAEK
jgi:hypothetical protein